LILALANCMSQWDHEIRQRSHPQATRRQWGRAVTQGLPI
jgi:hypothetical protein